MILSDLEIVSLCEDWDDTYIDCFGEKRDIPDPGALLTPFDPSLVGPASVDLRIGKSFSSPDTIKYYILKKGERTLRNPLFMKQQDLNVNNIEEYNFAPKEDIGFEVILEPKQNILCCSMEYVRMPPFLCGQISVKSSMAREWLDHSNAYLIHPGFHGNITFEVMNIGSEKKAIKTGMSLIQMNLIKMSKVPEKPYFERGIYQGQRNELYSRKKGNQK